MKLYTLAIFTICIGFFSCSSGSSNNTENEIDESFMENGVGPITEVVLGEIDSAMVQEGQSLYNSKCLDCHKIDKQWAAPAMRGIMDRRKPEWIMNMILNPIEMEENDPIAMELLAKYGSPMPNQFLKEEQARKILEYLRTL